MATVVPKDYPPPATYLGDSLYADFPIGGGLVRVWAQTGGDASVPLYFAPDTIAALLNYATRCYAPITGENDDIPTEH
jgi:hypothetical protein